MKNSHSKKLTVRSVPKIDIANKPKEVVPFKQNDVVTSKSSAIESLEINDILSRSDFVITQQGPKTKLKLKVQYKGYWFAVRVSQHGTEAVLGIYALLGYLPYSYESQFLRKNLVALVNQAGKELGGRVHFDEQQRIILSDYIRREGSVTPHFILTETTKIILKIRPYLELITALQPPKPKS